MTVKDSDARGARAMRAGGERRLVAVPLVIVPVLVGLCFVPYDPGSGGALLQHTAAASTPVVDADFEGLPVGHLANADFNREFGPGASADGPASNVSIVDDLGNRAMRIRIPKGATSQGIVRNVKLGGIDEFDELELSYRVRFSGAGFADMSKVKGGKLLGLAGGPNYTFPAGGEDPDGANGFSARMMFLRGATPEAGRLQQYVYHTDLATEFPGESDGLVCTIDNNRFQNKRAEWYTITNRVKMNTPGKRDGFIKAYINGVFAGEKTDYNFRNVGTYGINALMVNVYAGGGGREWSLSADGYVDLDDIVVRRPPAM